MNSHFELITKLNLLKARASQLCGTTQDGRPLNQAVEEYIGNLIADSTDPKKLEARVAFMRQAVNDPKLQAQLCGLRIEQFQNYLPADTNIMQMLFEVVTLKEDERPAFQNSTKQEIRVGSISQDGEPTRAKVVKPHAEGLIDLGLVTTPKVTYKVMDLYNGRVAEAALATLQLAADMANELDKRCWTLLTASVANGGAFGAFDFTNANKATHIYVPNSRVVTANLPDTNDITVYDCANFDYKVLDEILFYGHRWGRNAFLAGPLVPTGRILINPRDAKEIGSAIAPTGDQSNAVAAQMLAAGYTNLGVYKGVNWVLVEDNTLTTGFCIAEYNRKPGRVYFKPAMDREEVKDDYDTRLRNEQERYMQKAFGASIPSCLRVNVARFTWTAATS